MITDVSIFSIWYSTIGTKAILSTMEKDYPRKKQDAIFLAFITFVAIASAWSCTFLWLLLRS